MVFQVFVFVWVCVHTSSLVLICATRVIIKFLSLTQKDEPQLKSLLGFFY